MEGWHELFEDHPKRLRPRQRHQYETELSERVRWASISVDEFLKEIPVALERLVLSVARAPLRAGLPGRMLRGPSKAASAIASTDDVGRPCDEYEAPRVVRGLNPFHTQPVEGDLQDPPRLDVKRIQALGSQRPSTAVGERWSLLDEAHERFEGSPVALEAGRHLFVGWWLDEHPTCTNNRRSQHGERAAHLFLQDLREDSATALQLLAAERGRSRWRWRSKPKWTPRSRRPTRRSVRRSGWPPCRKQWRWWSRRWWIPLYHNQEAA